FDPDLWDAGSRYRAVRTEHEERQNHPTARRAVLHISFAPRRGGGTNSVVPGWRGCATGSSIDRTGMGVSVDRKHGNVPMTRDHAQRAAAELPQFSGRAPAIPFHRPLQLVVIRLGHVD